MCRTKRHTLLLTASLVSALLLTLTGCGGGSNSGASQSTSHRRACTDLGQVIAGVNAEGEGFFFDEKGAGPDGQLAIDADNSGGTLENLETDFASAGLTQDYPEELTILGRMSSTCNSAGQGVPLLSPHDNAPGSG